MDEARIHFGWFLRKSISEAGFRSVRAFAAKAGVTERTMMRLRKMEEPASYDGTLGGIAKALGFSTVEEFEKKWKTTKVHQPRARRQSTFRNLRLPRPLYDAISRKSQAAGKTIEEWLVEMSEETRVIAMTLTPPDAGPSSAPEPASPPDKAPKRRRRRTQLHAK